MRPMNHPTSVPSLERKIVTKRPTRVLAGLLAAALTAGAGVVVALGGPAAGDPAPLPWRTGAGADPDAVDQLTFHDASGAVVTGGNIDDAPFAAFASASSALRAGDQLATLFAYTPRSDAQPGAWTGLQLTAPTDDAHTTVPSALAGDPVVALTGSDTTLAQYLGGFANTSTTAGYQGVYELRLRTSAPGRSVTASYAVADIVVDGNTWRVAGTEAGAATTTTLHATPTSPKVGTSLTLTAGVSPEAAAGTVQFRDGTTALGAPVAVSAGAASRTVTVTKAGAHSYHAVFTPSDASAYSGSTGTADVTAAKATSTVTPTWPTRATYGTATSVKVKVVATGTTPTGTVTVKRGSTIVGTGTLSGGVATVKLGATSLPPGTASLVATYAGSADVAGSSSSAGSVKVARATARLTQRLSATRIRTTTNAKVTVTVAATGTIPTGTVAVYDGTKKIATGTLRGGKVVVTLPKLKRGTHKIKAAYAGSTLVLPVTGAVVTLTVTK